MNLQLNTLLKLPYITVEICVHQENEVYLNLRILSEKAACSHCGKLSSELHQNRPILMRYLSVFGQATYLKVPRRQFYCCAYQRRFTEVLAFIRERR